LRPVKSIKFVILEKRLGQQCFKLKKYQRVSGVPLRVINKSTGEIFSSLSAAAKSIGKKQAYLSARLRVDKHTGKTRCENDTDFEMYE
jgi:hypothetical protein